MCLLFVFVWFRSRDAFKRIGPAIFSGAMTTLLGIVVLAFTKSKVFRDLFKVRRGCFNVVFCWFSYLFMFLRICSDAPGRYFERVSDGDGVPAVSDVGYRCGNGDVWEQTSRPQKGRRPPEGRRGLISEVID